jgi:hypothetical protein
MRGVNREAVLDLIAQQQRSGCADFIGTEGQGSIRVTDRMLNQVIAMEMTPGRAVRDLQVRAMAGDRLQARVVLARPSFMPALTIGIVVERQPALPDAPVLIAKLEGAGGLLRLAGAATAFFNVLPRGIRVEGDRVHVDVRALLEARGLAFVLPHLDELRVHTEEGAVRVLFRARLR